MAVNRMCSSLSRFIFFRPQTCGALGSNHRKMSSGPVSEPKESYRLLVVGGGSGGCSMAAKFAAKWGDGHVGIIEPADTHFYQPLWTLVGGGLKPVEQSARPMESVLPKKADWIKAKATTFDPENCTVTTNDGRVVRYEYLLVAMGFQVDFHKVKGLPEALKSDPMVCSNYSRETVGKTWPALQAFQGGNALFTFPVMPIKCPGAPQKIMYLAEHHFKKTGIRDKTNIKYNTPLGVIFSSPYYAEKLRNICQERNIDVRYKLNLTEIRADTREAVFDKLGDEGQKPETVINKYDFIHVTPPMSAPDILKESPLVDKTGQLEVNKLTLQHVKYPNVFGIGDCTNVPTPKTAAAVGMQGGIVMKNLQSVMAGQSLQQEYDGYTSCPLVTGYGKAIMAEFDYTFKPLETTPLDQGKQRRLMYHMKVNIIPRLYWSWMLGGSWEGPAKYRKLLHFGRDMKNKAS